MSNNIAYRTDRIARYYRASRRRWDDFYPSERWVFERVAHERRELGDVLDVGCAAGGLGQALAAQFESVRSYTGVEINPQAIAAAREISRDVAVPSAFVAADICDCPQLAGRGFDVVTALSVADWNVDPRGIVAACWDLVAPGGHLVMSLRLTPGPGICNITESFQYIWFDPPPVPPDTERAPYNVFNVADTIAWLSAVGPTPEALLVYGYWGTPAASARTPYERLVFAVVAMRKTAVGPAPETPLVETHLPDDVRTSP